MKQKIMIRIGAFLSASALITGLSIAPAFAHGDDGDADEDSHTSAVHETINVGNVQSVAQMESLISLLKQLILLLNAAKIQQGYAPVNVPKTTASSTHDMHADMMHDMHDDMMDDDHHHDEMSSSTATATLPAHLVVEAETHHGQTHVHVRYVDKPEAMFFIDAPLTDVEGIIKAVVAKTGLTADVIRTALKVME